MQWSKIFHGKYFLLFIPHCIIFFYRFFFSVILFFCLIGTITEIYLGLLNPSAEHISKEMALENIDLKHGHIDTGTDEESLHDSTKIKNNKEGNMTFACLFVCFCLFCIFLSLSFLFNSFTCTIYFFEHQKEYARPRTEV